MRTTAACAVLAALTVIGCSVAGCSGGQSTPAAARLSTAVASRSSSAGAGTGAAGSAAAAPTGAAASSATGSAAGSAGSAAAAEPVDPADPEGSADATAKPVTVAGNITIAPAGTLKPGPITITPLYCGKLSAAQQRRFGTTAAGGLVFKYANHSGTDTGAPKLYVGFTDGATVAGENYGGNLPAIGPGQSAEGEVDAVGITNQDLDFTGCAVLSYALVTSAGVDPVSYAA